MSLAQKVIGNVGEVLIDRGMVYYPLLEDHLIETEAHANGVVKEKDGRIFIRGSSIDSLIKNYRVSNPEDYGRFKEAFLKEALPDLDFHKIVKSSVNQNIRVIALEIIPHFVRRKGFRREKFTEDEILGLVKGKINVGERYYKLAEQTYSPNDLRSRLEELPERFRKRVFPDAFKTIRGLESEVKSALEYEVVMEEKENLKKEISGREALAKKNLEGIATLLCLQDQKEFEIEDFGFLSNGGRHTLYLKTGEYALRDFDGRVYLFPPCKVGVVISEGELYSQPHFLDPEYRHPFGNDICIHNGYKQGKDKTENIINALEAGIKTVLFGYIDNVRNHQPRSGYLSSNFSRYLVSEDNPKIKSGRVKITNDPFITVGGNW